MKLPRSLGAPRPTETGPDSARPLSRWQAVPLALGSIAGSGILFLPSAVYVQAGANSVLVWVLATVMCVPMLVMFQDMVRDNPGGDGIEAFISAGLGRHLGRCVPVLFLAVVVVGLPAGALVAGEYVMRSLGGGRWIQALTAAAVLVAALAANLAGVRASTRMQHAGAWALVAMAVVLIGSAVPTFGSGAAALAPDPANLGVLLPGVVLAFWAFAGFENLTFLSREFRRPERDLLPVSGIALTVYGMLTVLLTFAIAATIPRGRVDSVTGLLQLAQHIGSHRTTVVTAIVLIAVGAMVLNAVAWTWGVSRMITGAAEAGTLPRWLAVTTGGPSSPGAPSVVPSTAPSVTGVPRRALALLAALFLAVGALLVAVPTLLVDALAAASSIFILLYLLNIVSYVRVRGLTPRSLPNIVLLVLFVVTLVNSGWESAYGLAVLAVALGSQAVRHHVVRRSTSHGSGSSPG